MSISNKRFFLYDLIRVVACMLVVLFHSPTDSTPGYLQSIIYKFSSGGVPLFFMISGALILPVRDISVQATWKRIKKVLIPTLIWIVFYSILSLFIHDIPIDLYIKRLLSIPFACKFNLTLWFMYALIGIYTISPIISSWLEKASKRDVEFILLFWLISSFLPILSNFIETDNSPDSLWYYGYGYAGYFLWGYYIRKYAFEITNKILLLMMFCLPFITEGFVKFVFQAEGLNDIYSYQSVIVVVYATSWYFILQQLSKLIVNQRIQNVFSVISNCTFGIYLVHVFFLFYLFDALSPFTGVVQLITNFVLTLLCSFFFTYYISRFSFSKYIVIYHREKKRSHD